MSEGRYSSETERRRFRPYPKYKDSGVEWLGEIPEHWKVYPFKRLFSTIYRYPTYFGIEYANDGVKEIRGEAIGTDGRIIVLEDQRFIPKELSDKFYRTILEEGDLVMSVRGTMGKIAYVDCRFAGANITANLLRLSPRPDLVNGQYLVKVIGSTYFDRQLDRQAPQTTIKTITMPQLAVIPIALPPKAEQLLTSSFLDHETAKIDALIAKKERLIELLQEKRTALITQAVTKGLDPNVPMKDSGVEWLGKIPAHWECLTLSRVSLARCDGPFGSGLKSEHYSVSGVRVVRLQNIGSAEFCDTDRAYINEEYGSQLGDHSVLPGDLLIAGLGDDAHPVGRACVAPEYIVPAMVKADCFRFRLEVRLLIARFAAYQLSATAAASAGALSTGATRSRLNLAAMATRKVALPPLREQAAIVSVLDRGCDENYALIAKIREAIERLKEYRTALISAAVTGKIDVRQKD
jgi:type I restriction enzyme S subunit